MSWLDQLLTHAALLPPALLTLFVFVSAWLEFVFPPYVGDSAMLLGFFLAGQGVVSPVEIFVAAVFGSILGSVVAFLIGERYGQAVLSKISFKKKRFEVSDRLKELFGTYGEAVLLVNRFIPFFRNFMLYGAGAFKLRPAPALLANAVSVVAFVSLLMGIGLWTAGSWEQIQAAFQNFYRIIGIVVVLAVSAWLMALVLRSRSRTDLPD